MGHSKYWLELVSVAIMALKLFPTGGNQSSRKCSVPILAREPKNPQLRGGFLLMAFKKQRKGYSWFVSSELWLSAINSVTVTTERKISTKVAIDIPRVDNCNSCKPSCQKPSRALPLHDIVSISPTIK